MDGRAYSPSRHALVAFLTFLGCSAGLAQDAAPDSFLGETLRPASDRSGIIDVESGRVANHLEYDVALWFGYANRPFRVAITDDTGAIASRPGAVIAHRVGANLVGQIALFDWVQLGADLAVVPFQLGGFSGPEDYAFFDVAEPAVAGLGDLRLIPKIRVLRAEDQFLDLAILPSLTIPTGFPTDGYLGEGGFTFAPELAVSKELAGLRIAANVGFRFRLPRTLLSAELGQEAFFRGGVGYDMADFGVPLGVDASLNGTTHVWPLLQPYHHKVEALVAATYDIWRLQLFAGPGFGLLGGAGVPRFRVFGGVRYAPRADPNAVAKPTDGDNDGITDDVDACPSEAEDPDGFEDTDGCPDDDNDGDGVADAADDCPLDKGPPDNRGCPVRDFDGDGVPDASDKCPDEPGPTNRQGCAVKDEDEDGTADAVDKCPEVPGPAARGGCPIADKDADGIPDADDTCPEVPGPVERQGCPLNDRDLDGVLDDADKCPEEKGPATNAGCAIPDKDGDGVEDAVDDCPEAPGPAAMKGCPDSDGDGVTDADDQCPQVAGLGMFAGCGDKDADGVADNIDKCPEAAEVINGVDDDDGCPDEGEPLVVITREKIEISERVFFLSGSTRLKKRSFPLLDQVAQALKANPAITRVRVEGHTDSVGGEASNLTLSQGRAETVVKYLVSKGVAPSRLHAQGFGEGVPLEPNTNEERRAKNRRVDFVIVNGGPNP